jgi:predicted PurR-regulated permease PerM
VAGPSHTARIARTIAIAAVGAAVVWGLYLARDALLIIYVSVLLAIGFGPIVHAIEHQQALPPAIRLPRWLAILLVYLAIVGALTVVGLLVVPPLIDQAQALWTALPGLLERGQTLLLEYGLLDRRITLEEAVRSAPATGGNAVETVATAMSRVVTSVAAFLTVLILTFYLLIESDSLFAGFARLFPRADRPRVEEVSRKISTKVSAWLNGQMILAGTIGTSAAVGLYLLGVPYFYVLALVAAFGEMIPIVGPVLSAIPAIAVAFSVSPRTALLVAMFFLAQQQLENHILVPKLMQRQVGVSATVVIVSLLVGGAALGIVGALLAVPTAAIIQVVVQELLDQRDRHSF